MVEYKKKKIQLQNGGSRNYYYKVLASGEKQRIKKEEYLEKTKKKGGEGENTLIYEGTLMKNQGEGEENTKKDVKLEYRFGRIHGTYDGKDIYGAEFSNDKKKLKIRTIFGERNVKINGVTNANGKTIEQKFKEINSREKKKIENEQRYIEEQKRKEEMRQKREEFKRWKKHYGMD